MGSSRLTRKLPNHSSFSLHFSIAPSSTTSLSFFSTKTRGGGQEVEDGSSNLHTMEQNKGYNDIHKDTCSSSISSFDPCGVIGSINQDIDSRSKGHSANHHVHQNNNCRNRTDSNAKSLTTTKNDKWLFVKSRNDLTVLSTDNHQSMSTKKMLFVPPRFSSNPTASKRLLQNKQENNIERPRSSCNDSSKSILIPNKNNIGSGAQYESTSKIFATRQEDEHSPHSREEADGSGAYYRPSPSSSSSTSIESQQTEQGKLFNNEKDAEAIDNNSSQSSQRIIDGPPWALTSRTERSSSPMLIQPSDVRASSTSETLSSFVSSSEDSIPSDELSNMEKVNDPQNSNVTKHNQQMTMHIRNQMTVLPTFNVSTNDRSTYEQLDNTKTSDESTTTTISANVTSSTSSRTKSTNNPFAPLWRPQSWKESWSIRGEKEYGIMYNSTILSPDEVSKRVGIQSTDKAPRWVWARSQQFWKRLFLPCNHRFDPITYRIRNLDQGLSCLWWKALSGNDVTSIVYDDEMTYDMLPSVTRLWVAKPFTRFYPRLLHVNVEMRTAYINQQLFGIIKQIKKENLYKKTKTKIRLISFGAGYDTRSLHLSHDIDACFELDRKEVIELKRALIARLMKRRRRRQERYEKEHGPEHQRKKRIWMWIWSWPRRWVKLERRQDDYPINSSTTSKQPKPPRFVPRHTPVLLPVDLNNVDLVRNIVSQILKNNRNIYIQHAAESSPEYINSGEFSNANESKSNSHESDIREGPPVSSFDQGSDDLKWHTIFLFEGVLIYLDKGVPSELIKMCADEIRKQNGHHHTASFLMSSSSRASLVFADRLDNIPGGDRMLALDQLSQQGGWNLIDWCPKPGLARHMGRADLY